MSASWETLAFEDSLIREQYALKQAKFDPRYFVALAKCIARNAHAEDLARDLEETIYPKAEDFISSVRAVQGMDAAFATPGAQALAESYLGAIADGSLLDSILRFARPIPRQLDHLLIASGATASIVAEGGLKPATSINLDSTSLSAPIKAAGMVVMSEELGRLPGKAAIQLFEIELRTAVLKAINASVLSALTMTPEPATGSALGDLKAGIAAAEQSEGYVVAAAPWVVRELAFASESRMGIAGGDFMGGLVVVPVDGLASMIVIPASRLAVEDWGLVLRNARHATIELAPLPTADAASVLTSLWQENLIGLMVERSYRMIAPANAVEVG
jgi:hypothetical protein